VTVPLPLPDDGRFQLLVASWPLYLRGEFDGAWPRSRWLHDFEAVLRQHYPHASSRELSLTARHAAPFPLRDGPDVP
jgi:hypothetical protein